MASHHNISIIPLNHNNGEKINFIGGVYCIFFALPSYSVKQFFVMFSC